MIDDVDDIAAFYNEDPQREHLRLEQHQLERALTWRYLDQHLEHPGIFCTLAKKPTHEEAFG